MAEKQQSEMSINNDGNDEEVSDKTQTINHELQMFINSKKRTGKLSSGKNGEIKSIIKRHKPSLDKSNNNNQPSCSAQSRHNNPKPKQTNTIDFTNIILEKDIPTASEEVIIDNDTSSSTGMGNSNNNNNNNISRELHQFVRTSPHVNRAFRIKKISSKNPRSLLKKKYVYIFEDPITPDVQQQIIIPQELINKTLLKKKNIPKIIVSSSQNTRTGSLNTITTATATSTTTTTASTTASSTITKPSTEILPTEISNDTILTKQTKIASILPIKPTKNRSIQKSDNVLVKIQRSTNKKEPSINVNLKIPKNTNSLTNNIVNNTIDVNNKVQDNKNIKDSDDKGIKLKSPKNYYPNYNRNDSLLNNSKFKALHNKFKFRKKYGASAIISATTATTSTPTKKPPTKTNIKKSRDVKSKKQKKLIDLHGANITINHGNETITTTMEIESNPNHIVNLNNKNYNDHDDDDDDNDNDDESEDIDIMNDEEGEEEEDGFNSTASASIIGITNPCVNQIQIANQRSIITENITVITPTNDYTNTIDNLTLEIVANLKIYPKELQEKLQSFSVPTKEYEMCTTSEVTEIEKYFFSEFFDRNSTAKTPARYKTIRNYILSTWTNEKPKYLNKIAIRFGLKHCGDVNCISRIHSLLEQLGAINFGHHKDQFEFIRPLTKLKAIFSQSNRTTKCISMDTHSSGESFVMSNKRLTRMPRACNSINSSSSSSSSCFPNGGNYDNVLRETYTSTSKLPSTIALNRIARKKELERLELIECLKFNDMDRRSPFSVSITLSTILCLQLHSLSVKYEVMGFLGGHFSNTNSTFTSGSGSSSSNQKLYITRYKPCRTLIQTRSTCEMCPISQVIQSQKLTAEGYDLLGWFHSHPAFAPNPSKTDIETQTHMQNYLFNDVNRPFVGFILSCLDFSYKCIFINKTMNEVPYEMSIEIIKDCSNITNEIIDVFNILDRNDFQYQSNINKFKQEAEKLLIENGYSRDVLSFMKDFE